MRVSSLSNEGIIRLVSDHFVPVWISRDNYQLAAPSKADRDLLARLDTSRRARKLIGGAVCVYLVRGDGEALAALPVQKACKPDQLAPFLRAHITAEKLTPRSKEEQQASAAPLTGPTARHAEGRLFTIRSRFEDKGTNRGTSKDVVELKKEEWSAFLPPAEARVGQVWKIPRQIAVKLLRHGYPPLPHWSDRLVRVTVCQLEGAVLAMTGNTVRVRLQGKLEMIYPDQGKPSDGKVTARIVGLAAGDTETGTLTELALTSDEGRYAWTWEGHPHAKPMALAVELKP